MPNVQNLKPFSKGDTRINRRGRPKNLDILRQLARDICYEPADISADQVAMTQLEAILREWLTSKDFQKQRAVIEYAFGKVPANLEVKKEKDSIIVEWTEGDNVLCKTEQAPLIDRLTELYDTADDDPDL